MTFTLITGGCTQNDGDIGDYFGCWKLESILADGAEEQLYGPETGIELYTWSFHSNVIDIITLEPYNEYTECFGTWSESSGVLELKFIYSDDFHSGDWLYNPPQALHLSADGITRLDIVRFGGGRMTLSRVADDGTEYTYTLKRLY